MATTFKHLLGSSAIGFVLAGLVWLAAWLGSALDSIHTLWPALGLGTITAGFAGAGVSLLTRRGAPKPPERASKRAKKRRRRHRLDRQPYRAGISPALRWLALSKPLQRLLRSADNQLVGKPVFSLLHPEDIAAVDQVFAAALATRYVHRVTCRFRVADQAAEPTKVKKKTALRSDTKLLPPLDPTSFVYVRFDICAKRGRDGKVSRFVCRFVDLTPQVLQSHGDAHRARKELARARKRIHAVGQDLTRLKLSYRELYQHAPVMYFSLDIDGKVVTCNDTLIHTLGYERHEVQNQSYTLLLAPSIRKSYVTIAENMPSQEGEMETQWRKKDGTQIDVWLHTVPVYDEAGHFVRYRSAALDLTEKNRLANESRARGDEVERTNQRLLIINSELEAFTHVVSHDLKEPLRTLQAYSHLLAEEHAAQLGPDGFQYINHLVRASRRLGTLIDELLNLSQAGRITKAPRVFNVLEVVATVRQDLVDLIQRKQATLLTEGSLPAVIGDMARITQLVTNLVTNGLKYNQHPVPQVVIGSRPCDDDPAHITIYVRDNGIGIDPAFHQQIFGIFRRLHQDDQYEGTGAGLAICKKIVEGHGGRIWVESTPGQGAAFFFTLPYPPPRDSAHDNGMTQRSTTKSMPLQAARPERRTALKLEPRANAVPRIVLVEDQADVAMVIQKLGKRDGLDIIWFPTAEEAWDYLQFQDPDLMLLDVNLPGISGVELCRRIRTLAHLKETPVAMFTPDQEPEQQAEYREAGADFFLTKDLLCQPAAWQRRIQELLEQIRQPLPH
jgi:PAS domain S-box-containing protein